MIDTELEYVRCKIQKRKRQERYSSKVGQPVTPYAEDAAHSVKKTEQGE